MIIVSDRLAYPLVTAKICRTASLKAQHINRSSRWAKKAEDRTRPNYLTKATICMGSPKLKKVAWCDES